MGITNINIRGNMIKVYRLHYGKILKHIKVSMKIKESIHNIYDGIFYHYKGRILTSQWGK